MYIIFKDSQDSVHWTHTFSIVWGVVEVVSVPRYVLPYKYEYTLVNVHVVRRPAL